jgi:uncharacterized membrane protein
MQWYYSKSGSQSGPVDDVELQRLARTGEITPEDFVWNETMGDAWQPASSVSGLFASAGDQPPSIPQATSSTHLGNGMTPNRDLMRMARESLKGKWGMAVLATLIYFVVVFLLMIPQMAVQIPYTIHAQQAQMQAIAAAHQAHQSLTALPHPKLEIPLNTRLLGDALQVIQIIISAPLIVGLIAFFLKITRHTEASLSDLFSGFRIFWKSVGTYFLWGLLYLGWTLLFCAPAIGLMVWAIMSHQTSNHLLKDGIVTLAAIGYIIAIIKVFSYSLSFFVLADEPTIRPFQAIRKSKQMMEGKKWKFFCLYLRFLGWTLLSLLTCGIGLLWMIPYMTTAMSHFYLDVKDRAS